MHSNAGEYLVHALKCRRVPCTCTQMQVSALYMHSNAGECLVHALKCPDICCLQVCSNVGTEGVNNRIVQMMECEFMDTDLFPIYEN